MSFTDSDLRNDTFTHSQQTLSTKDVHKGEIGSQEGSVNCFTSLLGLPSTSTVASQPNIFDSSPGELGSSSLTSTGYKRVQSSGTEDETVKEKKRKGNKQCKHGPGRPKGNKSQDNVSHLSVCSASPTSSVASAAGSIASSNLQKSPTLLRNGSLQSLSVGSSPVGSGRHLYFFDTYFQYYLNQYVLVERLGKIKPDQHSYLLAQAEHNLL